MTDKEIYQYMLIEMNKVEAPSLLLEDYNYFINKAINNYVKNRYKLYDTRQETTDDLQVLTGTIETVINYGITDGDSPVVLPTSPNLTNLSGPNIGAEFRATMTGTIPGMVTPMNPVEDIDDEQSLGKGELLISGFIMADDDARIPANGSGIEGYSDGLNGAIKISDSQAEEITRFRFSVAHGLTSQTLINQDLEGYEYIMVIDGSRNYKGPYRVVGVGGSNVTTKSYSLLLDTPYRAETVNTLIVQTEVAPEDDPSSLGSSSVTSLKFRLYLRKKTPINLINGETITVKRTTYGYLFPLPNNYYHLLNCIVNFEVTKDFKCYKKGTLQPFGCKRLTADMFSFILNNAYLKPEYKRPYFYIRDRISNTAPDMEVRIGDAGSSLRLHSIIADYLRVPTKVNLTNDVVENPDNPGTPMEFPDYVCQEIIKELTILVMENSSDQRLNSNIAISNKDQ